MRVKLNLCSETDRNRHGSEIPSVFGLVDTIKGGKPTPDQIKLSDYMNTMWAEFAKDSENGLTKLGVPSYEPKGRVSF
jgi:carboxylesterase type B